MNRAEHHGFASHGRLHRAGATLAELWAQLGRTRALGLAAEMSFWLFVSLLPLAAVAAYLAARFALGNWSLTEPLLASMPPDARSVLGGELHRVSAWNGGAVTPVAGASFVWLASTGGHSIFDAFEAQTGVQRSWFTKRAIAIGCCVLLSCACAAVALLGAAMARGAQTVGAPAPPAFVVAAERAIQVVAAVVFLYGLIAALYRVGLPREVTRRIPLAPGTALVVGLQAVLGVGYRLYLHTLGDGGAYLAGLAVIAVTMTSIYLFSASVLIGLALNQVLGHDARPAQEGAPKRHA
jgi:membrane protein